MNTQPRTLADLQALLNAQPPAPPDEFDIERKIGEFHGLREAENVVFAVVPEGDLRTQIILALRKQREDCSAAIDLLREEVERLGAH